MATLVGAQPAAELDLEAVEMALRERTLRLAAGLVQQRLNADHSDHQGSHLPCRCGQHARYVDRRTKTFTSVLGELELERAYYHCSACQQGFCPRDRALKLERFPLSPGVLRMTGAAAALVSFEESSQLLKELAGISVNAKMVERAAEALGAEIAADERQDLEPIAVASPVSTLYLGMDGTGIPMRATELVGRTGKQPDGSAKTREVKLCTVWSAEARDADGIPLRDEGSVSYSAAVESAASPDTDPNRSEFAERVLREATRRDFCKVPRQVVLGDGAVYIWNIAKELFPRAIQIVDRYHVKGHLIDVSKALYGATSEEGKLWRQQRCDELDDGSLGILLEELRRHAANCEKARECADYIRRNRDRMRYAEFHAQGLCTSTGVLEAGCKVAIGTRLKRTGMHWTVRGANAIIALRCCRLSGRFEDFWERRSQRMAA
jgi:hypothetical protein